MFRRRAPTAAVRAGEIVMPYLYNAWYCAGWSADLGAAPTGIRMLDMDVVLYRRADGAPVAVSGICPHRFAPLSLGRVDGDNLRSEERRVGKGGGSTCRA